MSTVLWRGRAESALLRGVVAVLMSVITAVVVFTNPSARPEKQIQGMGWLYFVGIMLLSFVAVMVFTRLNVEVLDDEVRITYGWGWPVQHIRWDKVSSVQVINVRPTEWGGWGYRWVPWKRGTAAVMRAGSGFRFDFANGKVFVVTVDDAEAGLEVIRGVLGSK